jgi:hypothetical protein
VTRQDGHRVVDSGPYRLVRHPIYVGFIVIYSGLALLTGSALALVGFGLMTVGLIVKARAEEEFLSDEIGGAAYADYKARTPMLVPRMAPIRQETNAEQSLPAVVAKLASIVDLRPPATDETIAAVERRFGVRLSSDFREVYGRLDGTADGTPPENGWIELWSMARWYTVEEYVQEWPLENRAKFKDIAAAVVFADYSIESWHYAAVFSSEVLRPTASIYLLHRQPYLVSESLNGFLEAALVDGPAIYPPSAAE